MRHTIGDDVDWHLLAPGEASKSISVKKSRKSFYCRIFKVERKLNNIYYC
jgi:hypothetical protein